MIETIWINVLSFYASNTETIWSVIVSNIFGGLITLLIAWIYYKRAGNELREESKELRRLNLIMLSLMEEQGWAKLVRDAPDHLVGVEAVKNITGRFHLAVPEKDVSATGPAAAGSKDG